MVIWRNENNDKNPTDDAKEIYDRKMQEPIPPPDPKIFTQSISDVVREKDEDKSLPFGFLPPDSTAHILANQRFLLPENRNYLIRPRDMKALEEQRANDSALADHGWWKSMTGFNMSYLDNMINSFGYLFSGPKLGNLVHGQNTTSYSTMTGQRGMPEKRACDWQMHQFQMCLAVHTQNPNPQWMFPHPYIPPLFGLDWILCKQTYFCPECADFRLLAEQVCDPTERIMYINREVWDYVAQAPDTNLLTFHLFPFRKRLNGQKVRHL